MIRRLAALALPLALMATVAPVAGETATSPRRPQASDTAVDHQRAEVQRLRRDVAAREADSREAARRLRQQDAKIAELQRQLQAARPAATGAAAGH